MARYDYRNDRVSIRPNHAQRSYLFRCAGARRLVWNQLVEGKKEGEIRASLPWLSELPPEILRNAITDYDAAKKWNRNPGFKSKTSPPSFRLALRNSRLTGDRLTIPGLGTIRLRGLRPNPKGALVSYQFSQDRSGRWWCTIARRLALPAPRSPRKPDHIHGIDIGLHTLATSSCGNKRENPWYGKAVRPKASALLSRLKNMEQGSKAWVRLSRRIALLQIRAKRRRDCLLHYISRRIVDASQGLGLETLDAAEISRTHRNNLDASMGHLSFCIAYKAAQRGIPVHQVSRWYPSSKTCSSCGYVHRALKETDREWTCPQCGAHHDRDVNAAKNLRNEAINSLMIRVAG